MKRMTLDETWKNCLSMWRWIAKQKRAGSRKGVNTLKREWLTSHGFEARSVCQDCFFCHYKSQFFDFGCGKCPGSKVGRYFNCGQSLHNWKTNPIAFYNKLVSLDRKRRKAKKAGKK